MAGIGLWRSETGFQPTDHSGQFAARPQDVEVLIVAVHEARARRTPRSRISSIASLDTSARAALSGGDSWPTSSHDSNGLPSRSGAWMRASIRAISINQRSRSGGINSMDPGTRVIKRAGPATAASTSSRRRAGLGCHSLRACRAPRLPVAPRDPPGPSTPSPASTRAAHTLRPGRSVRLLRGERWR